MSNEVTLWDKVLTGALSMPGVKINREDFLRKELRPYCSADQLEDIIASNPIHVLSKEAIDKVANSCIVSHTVKVTALSTAAGIPGGLAIVGTIPADMAQYYWHVFVLSQKLAYLYGFPDLCDKDGHLTDGASNLLTIFVGVMMGAAAANQVVRNIAKELAKNVVKRLPQQALTKTTYYPIIKQLSKWITEKSLTKAGFAKGLGKFIPVLGGIISGGITLASFKPGANRLKKKLQEQMDLFAVNNLMSDDKIKSDDKANKEIFTDYEDVNDKKYPNLDILLISALINMSKIDFDLASEEISYITDMINDSALDDNDKLTLVNQLHSKALVEIDFSLFKESAQYSTTLISKLVEIAKIDNVVKPVEKIYLYKIANDLGITKESIDEMLNTI